MLYYTMLHNIYILHCTIFIIIIIKCNPQSLSIQNPNPIQNSILLYITFIGQKGRTKAKLILYIHTYMCVCVCVCVYKYVLIYRFSPACTSTLVKHDVQASQGETDQV